VLMQLDELRFPVVMRLRFRRHGDHPSERLPARVMRG
jgi:hypothetical protein